MLEFKFGKLDFRNFMDFVLALVDYYGLGQVRFHPDKPELFNETQLTHIAPGRDFYNPNGFARAWFEKKERVREVSFDQFSDDKTKKVNISIDLNKQTIKLNSVEGIPSTRIKELIKDRFDIMDYEISYGRLEKIETRISILEFSSALFFSFCFTLIFAIIKIQNIWFNWLPIVNYFIIFFGASLFLIYIIFPLIRIFQKLRVGIKGILLEFIYEFKNKTRLSKLKTILAITLAIINIILFFK